MNHSQKKRLENVWEALKHDKIAIFSIIFLALILILSLLAPVLPLEPNKTDVAHMLEAPSSAIFSEPMKWVVIIWHVLSTEAVCPCWSACLPC